uniref:Nucleoporin NUP42 n=1 Tax=Heliothis virescens TaxID=7102 RepID=A0A2A4J1V8_HELVI
MVVCKFFQMGCCRYGKNCRFEHIYGSKYTYNASQPPQPVPSQTQSVGVTDEQLVKQVQSDVVAVLKGGQWILSCYAPFKEKQILPGISDLSPEEARLFIYEAKNTNNVDQAVMYYNNLVKETRQKYEQLVQPNLNTIQILRRLYNGETVSSPFSNEPQTMFIANPNNVAASIFQSAVQAAPVANQTANSAQSIFGQAQNSIFNQQAAPDPAKQLFAQANQISFAQSQPSRNIFGQQNTSADPKSIFAVAAQNNFNQTNQSNPTDIFAQANQNIFAREPSQNNSPFSQGNVFQPAPNPASIFGQASNKLQMEDDSGAYSKMEELAESDLEAFKSDRFQLGFIPELPPPYEMCTAQPQLFS